jgi:hypothetical protein
MTRFCFLFSSATEFCVEVGATPKPPAPLRTAAGSVSVFPWRSLLGADRLLPWQNKPWRCQWHTHLVHEDCRTLSSRWLTLLWDLCAFGGSIPLFPKLVMYIGQSRQLLYKFLLTRVAIGQPSWPLPRFASIRQYHALARRALRRAYRHRLRRDVFETVRCFFWHA